MIEESEPQQSNYLEQLRPQMQNEQIGPGLTPPSELFHYTTAEGLLGILSTDSIWATNFRYVNDLTEFKYANDLLRGVLKEKLQGQEVNVRYVFQHIMESPDMLLAGADLYLACFCENGDLLSQWRAYGVRGGGYALGLKPTEVCLSQLNPRHTLHRVTYSEEQQLTLIRFLVDAYARDIDRCGESPSPVSYQQPAVYLADEAGPNRLRSSFEGTIGVLTVALAEAFVEIACCFKNPHFKEEREWRLVQRGLAVGGRLFDTNRAFRLEFRCAGTNIIPYVSIPLRLNLHGVHLGSCLFMSVAVRN